MGNGITGVLVNFFLFFFFFIREGTDPFFRGYREFDDEEEKVLDW